MTTAIRAHGALEVGKIGEHGQRIFVYRHTFSNRIVYSLSRTLDNSNTLKQMYFLGKKTIGTPKIRKDVWAPFATISFPSGYQGLAAFQQLREYAKRHLMEWTEDEVRQRIEFDGMDKLMTRAEVKERHEKARLKRNEITVTVKRRKTDRKWLRQEMGPALTNQKANSVADMAMVMKLQYRRSVLEQKQKAQEQELNDLEIGKAHARLAELLKVRKDLEGKDDEESRQKYRVVKLEKMKLQRALKKPVPWAALRGRYHIQNDNRPPAKRGPLRQLAKRDIPRFTMEGVKIEWADIYDKGFANEWPSNVAHDEMLSGGNYWRNTATTAFIPPVEPTGGVISPGLASPLQTGLPEAKEEQTGLAKLISRLRFGATRTAPSSNEVSTS